MGFRKKRPKFDCVKTCVIDVYSANKANQTMNRVVSANLKQGMHLQCGTKPSLMKTGHIATEANLAAEVGLLFYFLKHKSNSSSMFSSNFPESMNSSRSHRSLFSPSGGIEKLSIIPLLCPWSSQFIVKTTWNNLKSKHVGRI